MNQEKINELHTQIFNKLFFELSLFKQKEIEIDNIGKINHVFYTKNRKIWFSRIENENKYFYVFGLNKKSEKEDEYELIIDFSKNNIFCDNCIGILMKNTIYINKDNLIKEYTNLKLDEYKIKNFRLLNNEENIIECIEIGNIEENFIDTLEKIILDINHSKKIINNEIQKTTTYNSISETKKIILKAIKRKRSREEAAILANIPLYKITHWYNEGKNGYGNENKIFYKQLKSIENEIQPYSSNELETLINNFLNEFKKTENLKKSIENIKINENEINDWFTLGEKNINPYNYFLIEYNKILKNNHEKEDYFSDINTVKRKIFLEYIKNNKSFEEACEHSSMDMKLLNEWLEKGRQNIKPYDEFYKKCYEINQKSSEKSKKFLNYIEKGFSLKEACYKSENNLEIIKNKIINNYDFYLKIVEARLLNKLNGFPKIIKSSGFGSNITIDQMNKIIKYMMKGYDARKACLSVDLSFNTYEHWINRGKQEFGEMYIDFYNYTTKINELKEEIDEEIFEFKENINTESSNNEDNLNNNILKPLPEEYEKSFISSPHNKSGFAWTNKVGNQWIYTRNINGKTITISDPNIYKLHEKVLEKNQIWGVRDFDKAKKTLELEQETTETLPKTESDNDEKEINIEYYDKNILNELPDKYKKIFGNNKSGFAWVSKVNGDTWIYKRVIKKKKIQILDENIYKLYEKVKNENQIWGITNLSIAKNTLNNEEIPEYEPKTFLDKNILAILPEEYEKSFISSPHNKSGFAWTNKVGNQWIYTRNINGKTITISDPNIYKLHEKVLEKNQIWGVRDLNKAKNTLRNEEPNETLNELEKENNLNVFYISNEEFNMNIIIKGLIQENELLNNISKLKLFENNISRIISTKINNKIDLMIEMNIDYDLLSRFEKEIKNSGWILQDTQMHKK